MLIIFKAYFLPFVSSTKSTLDDAPSPKCLILFKSSNLIEDCLLVNGFSFVVIFFFLAGDLLEVSLKLGGVL